MIIRELDFQPLFQWINENLGTNADFTIRLEGKRPQIVNIDNLWNDSGIFQSVIKEVEVGFFNYNYEDGKLWATIGLSYGSWSGGSNGMQIGTCWFNPETGWKFESCKERAKKNNQQ